MHYGGDWIRYVRDGLSIATWLLTSLPRERHPVLIHARCRASVEDQGGVLVSRLFLIVIKHAKKTFMVRICDGDNANKLSSCTFECGHKEVPLPSETEWIKNA